MWRFLVLAVLFAAPVYAQNSGDAMLIAAGCGSIDVKFEVKTDKNAHPMGTPDADKAMVYVIGDTLADNAALHIGSAPTRIGIDGAWVAAIGYKSYVFFQVTPGDHRLCTDNQVIVKSAEKKSTAAASFTAAAGQSYYFHTVTPIGAPSTEQIQIEPMDPAAALVLIAKISHSTFEQKK